MPDARGMKTSFANLNFGMQDATDEAATDPQRFCQSYFDPDHVACDLMSFKKFLVLGPKPVCTTCSSFESIAEPLPCDTVKAF